MVRTSNILCSLSSGILEKRRRRFLVICDVPQHNGQKHVSHATEEYESRSNPYVGNLTQTILAVKDQDRKSSVAKSNEYVTGGD